MSTAGHSPSKSKKEKDRREKPAQQPSTEQLKTVVRRLPPNLPEDVFWQTVQRWVTDETAIWKIYYSGKFKKRLNKENIPSRAYIAFKDEDLLVQFSREFDGHLFRDKAGNESYAIVEYAPHQKVPSEKRKQDSKNNTIEKDEDYISFLESLNAPDEPVTMESLIASTRPPSPPKTTPLLEALKAEKSAQKDKDAILRNHAHYKDQANVASIASNPSRKEEKKKVHGPSPPKPISNQASKSGDAPASLSKKARKAAREAKELAQASKGPSVKNGPEPKPAGTQASSTSSKPTRQQLKQAKIATQVAAAAPLPVILGAKTAISPTPTASTSNGAAASAQAALEAPAQQRRARAVLGRHLEVALAGVGASARARKEREKERAKEILDADAAAIAVSGNNDETGHTISSDAAENDNPAPTIGVISAPPASPQRSRNRRGGGPSGAAGNQAHGSTAANMPSGPKPVQHPESGGPPIIFQNTVNSSTVPGPSEPVVRSAGLGGAPAERGRGGGGRRGRGRGRGGGRGGQPTRGG